MSAPRSSSSFRGGAASSRGGSVSGSGPGRKREEDDGLDPIDFSDGAGASMHRVSRAPRSRPSSGEYELAPSVVVAPHAEEPPASQPRKKRGQEPTLVIRDRRQVQEIRAQVEQIGRRKAASRRRSVLLWVGAGLTAFALGGAAVSFLGTGSSLASSLGGSSLSGSQSNVPVPAAPALPASELASGKPAIVTPAIGAEEAQRSARVESVPSVAVTSPSPAATSESPASTEAALPQSAVAKPLAAAPVAPLSPSKSASKASSSEESVVSVDELSDAAKKKQSASKSVAAAPARDGNVVSLEDLPTE
jgi:hypothetical protein